MSEAEEPSRATAFGSQCVDRVAFRIESAGVIHVVAAATERTTGHGVADINGERHVQADGRVQTAGWSPRPIADAGNEFSGSFRGDQGNAHTIDGECEVWGVESCDVHLQAFDGRIHIACGASAARFFAEHIPWFKCLAEIDVDSGRLKLSDARTAEFEMWCEPVVIKPETGLVQPCGDLSKIVPEEVREQAAIVECISPVNERFAVRLLPERCHQGSHQQLLCEAHAGMRWHFEAAEFDESESSGGVVG